jgi:serine/threonine-protein kinase
MSTLAPPLPDTRADLVLILAMMAVEVTRAALLPSTTRRTAALGIAMSVPILAVGYHVGGHVSEMYDAPRFIVMVNDVLWCIVTVTVASLTSRVIYGLRREVEQAQRVGQYTLEEKIGEGGMGAVYRARHALLRRPTAVKLLPPDKAGLQNLTRFEREVQLTSQLTHPNTVAIFDYGHTPEGIFYYAMEYLDGLDLERVVAIDGPQPPSRVVHILTMICGALVEAHGIGLVHRDIKPANVILCERGGLPDVAKVVDFGLVKQLSGSDSNASIGPDGHAGVVGTPHYMSPEGITSPDRVDARSDIYALGALAYFLLTGTPVFHGNTIVEVCGHHLHTAPERPSVRLGHPLPDTLERVVLACLEKDPSRRPQSASELRGRLSDCGLPRWTEEQARAWWSDARDDERLRRRRAELPRLLGQTFAVNLAQRA